MSERLSESLIGEMLQGLTPKPWASVSLHTGEPPRDPAWTGATPVYVDSAWTQERGDILLEPGTMCELVIRELVDEWRRREAGLWSGGRLLGTVPVSEPGDILGRIDAALEGWERDEDAMRWRPE